MSLMTTDELAALIGTAGLVVLDVRADLADPSEGLRRYEAGHLPGAVFVDLKGDLTGRTGPGRHPLPRPEEFSATVRRLGIGPDSTVVVYDDSGGMWAARLWWMLRSLGHPNVLVLDGGITAWNAEGKPVTQATLRSTPGDFATVREWRGVVDRTAVSRTGATVVDARTEERFRGEHEPIDPVAGHIPGAINLPHTGNLTADGRFLDTAALVARYADVGSRPIVYCGSGVTACHDILAMSLAGVDDALLYEGSWSDWCRSDAPIATGPA